MTNEQKRNLKEKLAKFNPLRHNDSPFYDIKPLTIKAHKEGATYILPVGKRSKGKSYSVKELILFEAYSHCEAAEWYEHHKKVPKEFYKFAYIRRWDRDITETAVRQYFKDFVTLLNDKGENKIYEITEGNYNDIVVYHGEIYFALNEEGKITKKEQIGYIFAVNLSSRYKSRWFDVYNCVYEEFIPEKGVKYVPNEVSQFTSIISTVLRNRDGRVFLIGNTFSRINPYRISWGLTDFLKMKPGDIQTYAIDTGDKDKDDNPIVIKIIIEMTSADGLDDKTTLTQRDSIVKGEWDSDEQPHLPEYKTIEDYEILYDFLLDDLGFCFRFCLIKLEDDPVLFVYPYTGDKSKVRRQISDEFSPSPFVTRCLEPLTRWDDLCRTLVRNKKILFSDNQTGTDAYAVIKQRGGL